VLCALCCAVQGANVQFRYCDFSKNVAGQGAGVAIYNLGTVVGG
jgi:hypothetical protein